MSTPYSYRGDPGVPAFADDRAIIVFDGKCVMCSWFANFVMRRDPQRRFRLLAAQTPLGEALCRHYRLDPLGYETNILIERGVAYFTSEASIRIFEQLGFPWRMVGAGRLLPLRLRDGVYEIVARNRLKWFGVREICYLASPEDADRFL